MAAVGPENLRGAVSLARARGVDASQFQGRIDWAKVAASGIEFSFIRFADGLFRDTRFEENWSASLGHLLRGAYHYLRSALDAEMQARALVEALERSEHGPGELPPVIDVEKSDAAPAIIAAHAAQFSRIVYDALGVLPIIYTGRWFWNARVQSDAFRLHPLWLAQYLRASEPESLPAPWATWTFWQHSCDGRVPGIARQVDLDVFNGDSAALQEFARLHRPQVRA